MIKQWKTKPVLIEAVQWTGRNEEEMEEFGVHADACQSLELGSYVVRNAKGRLEVYSYTAFHETHERSLVWEDNI